MKILRLTMHNFGIYAGTNTIDFSNDKPVILIGGLNGRGKTTLLEAVLLVLYGKRSFAFAESKIAFPRYIAGLVNTTDQSHRAWIKIDFKLPSDNDYTTYTVRREWSTRSVVSTMNTSVEKDGQPDQLLSENWDVFMEEMLPSSIAPLFFFDGEKISELATSGSHQAQMKDSVRALLGITIIDQTIADIDRITKLKQKMIKSDDLSQEIELMDQRVKQTEKQIKAEKQVLGELNVRRLKLQSELSKMEDKFAATGGNLAVNRNELLKRKSALLNKFEETTTDLLEIAYSDLPLMLVLPMLKDILVQAEHENKQRSISTAMEQLPQLFSKYSATNKQQFDMDEFINYVKNSMSGEPILYNLTEQALFKLKTLCVDLGDKRKREAKQIIKMRHIIKGEILDLDSYLAINVNEEEASKNYKTILDLTAELATVTEQHRIAELSVLQCESQLEGIQRERDKIVEQAVGNLEETDDTKRILQYARRLQDVLVAYKERLQQQKSNDLAETITICFRQIASKRELISKIAIDPTTLDFHYFNGSGAEVDHAIFSAGEKQLLMIAMLWGLGISSGKQFPIMIDTPLARLDNAHREALILHYFPKASSQTILLSTDSEVHGEYYNLLKPYIDKSYTLLYDDTSNCSRVEEGYFRGEH